MARRSVAQKLAMMMMTVALAALLLAMGAMVAYDLRLYHRGWVADLATQAELVARNAAPALAFDDERVAQETLSLLRFHPDMRAGAIYDARGRLVTSFLSAQGTSASLPQLPGADGVRVEGGELVAFKRVINDGEILGTVYLRSRYALYDRLLGYLGIGGLVAGVTLLTAYALSRRLRRTVTRPLAAIAAAAREVTENRSYSHRVAKLSEDEIGYLADCFNSMLAEIERSTRELSLSNEQFTRLNTELEQRVQERTAQLQYTNKELEAFCYSVSHDLRAPLRSIDGFSQALVEDYAEALPEEARRYLARVRTATQRMAQLIEDLLNLSRVSRAELQRQELDLGHLARQVAAELRARDSGRRVELAIWDDLGAHGDPRLLRAALENLLANAWKFTAKAEAPRVEVGALRDGGQATYFVRDNGAGFDMAYADKLFGAFQRLHAANEYPGTGIGLATVQRIVHRHGGRVWAEGRPGKGAVFYFTLGEDRKAPATAPQPAEATQ